MKKRLSLFLSLLMLLPLIACASIEDGTGKTNAMETDESSKALSEEEYRDSCQDIGYKELCRYPEEYEKTKVHIKVKIQQILTPSLFETETAWRGQTDNDGYGWYMDDEYYLLDKRDKDAVKILEDDIVILYGEFVGLEEVTRALTGTKNEIPRIKVKYADIVEDKPEKTYEEVFEEYSQKMREAALRLIEEFNEEATKNEDGIMGLAEISNKKVGELAEISNAGI